VEAQEKRQPPATLEWSQRQLPLQLAHLFHLEHSSHPIRFQLMKVRVGTGRNQPAGPTAATAISRLGGLLTIESRGNLKGEGALADPIWPTDQVGLPRPSVRKVSPEKPYGPLVSDHVPGHLWILA
jgi:hypothetical protein